MEDKETKDKNEKNSNNEEEEKKENDNKSNEQKKIEMTKEQEQFIMDTLKRMQLSKNSKNKDDSDDEIKDEYKFWGTQPVPQFNKECSTTFGEIWKDHKVEDLEKEPLTLPEGYEWKDVDLSQQVEMDKLYEFLKSNYVEDDDHMFRFDYSKDFLKWHLNPPGFYPEWLISVLKEDKIKKKKKMVGFIAGLPVKVNIHGTDITLAEIDFLCVKKELRSKRLAPVLIQEVSRRIHMRNMWWAVYTSGTLLPTPFCKTIYFHRNLNVKKLVDIGFTYLPPNMNMARAKKLYDLPKELPLQGFRPMEPKDVNDVYLLLDEFEKKYKVHGYYSKEEVAHWFLPRRNVIYSYVRVNKENKVTDLISFYCLPSSVLQNPNYKKLMAAYSFFNINTSCEFKDLMKCALILAKKENFDVYNCLNIMENETIFKDLLFGQGDGTLKYYFWNFVCPKTEPKDLSLVLM